MPKVGLRTIKTAIAVMITLFIYILLYIMSPEFASTWYSPFFASIAATYSMQREYSKSFALAKIRSFGSLIGGLFGMVLVLLYEAFLSETIISMYGEVMNMFVLYLLTGFFIIILIYILVRFKVHDLVFVAALTYLSVTISLRNDLPVVPFAINRISSTIIGVLITLAINNIRLHIFRNKHILFVSGLDQCLLSEDKSLTPYTSYALTSLLNDGLNFTISTTRTPASLSKILYGLPLTNELMIMNGAVSYDIRNEHFLDVKYIDKSAQKGISHYFSKINRNVFTYSIIDQALSIYHTEFENELEEKFYLDRKNDYFRNHIKGKISLEEGVVFYILIDTLEIVNQYVKDLLELYGDVISCQIYPYSKDSIYYFLKIYTSSTSKQIALNAFIKNNHEGYVIAFGSKSYDIDIMQMSDFSFALSNADEEVKAIADIIIPSENPDEIIRTIKSIYYSRKYELQLTKLKKYSQINKTII